MIRGASRRHSRARCREQRVVLLRCRVARASEGCPHVLRALWIGSPISLQGAVDVQTLDELSDLYDRRGVGRPPAARTRRCRGRRAPSLRGHARCCTRCRKHLQLPPSAFMLARRCLARPGTLPRCVSTPRGAQTDATCRRDATWPKWSSNLTSDQRAQSLLVGAHPIGPVASAGDRFGLIKHRRGSHGK
jgi:hypothetical protein